MTDKVFRPEEFAVCVPVSIHRIWNWFMLLTLFIWLTYHIPSLILGACTIRLKRHLTYLIDKVFIPAKLHAISVLLINFISKEIYKVWFSIAKCQQNTMSILSIPPFFSHLGWNCNMDERSKMVSRNSVEHTVFHVNIAYL